MTTEISSSTRQLLIKRLRAKSIITVMVPSIDLLGAEVDVAQMWRQVVDCLHAVATGTTTLTATLDARGTWVASSEAPVISEAVQLVVSVLPESLPPSARRRLVDRFQEIAIEARQEALFIAVDGDPFLLPGVTLERGNAA